MRYYFIAGEASGDLHASRLMHSLKEKDPQAVFRFYGGDKMAGEGGTMVKHYSEMAYMGFIPVLMHLPTILKNLKRAKRDIAEWQPDVVVLVDYPGFNLKIARYVKEHIGIPVFYYISPKIWAWKEYRIKSIKRYVDEMFSILPFEVDFFEGKHHYPIHYVGNPTADEVNAFRLSSDAAESLQEYTRKNGLADMPIIALLAGSRRQEIKKNLPAMIQAAEKYCGQYQMVLACAPGIEPDFYRQFIDKQHGPDRLKWVQDGTYSLLAHAHAALVTSGTATLETALFGVPQVVCYKMSMKRFTGWLRKMLLKVRYVSLVNLIADREVVAELVADTFTQQGLDSELAAIMPDDSPRRKAMLEGYKTVGQRLGDKCAPENAAQIMTELLQKTTEA